MDIKKGIYVLIAIFLASLSMRLAYSLQVQEFSDSGSYFVLRQIDNIKNTGKPLYNDPLSYGGRFYPFMPLFHYLLTCFSFFFPSMAALKILTNILAASIVFPAYLLAHEVTKNNRISLLAAFMSAFIPLYVRETINDLSEFSLLIPLSILFLYLFLRLSKDKKNIRHILVVLFMMVLASPNILIILIALTLYLGLCYIEKIRTDPSEIELVLFSLFFFFWTSLIIFKKAFILHGMDVIRANIPQSIIESYFIDIMPLEIVTYIGILPMIFGSYIIYEYLMKKKNRSIYLLIGVAVTTFILGWLKFISITAGLLYLGIALILLFAQFLKELFIIIRKSKIAQYEKLIFISVILVLGFSSVVPSMVFVHQKISEVPSLQKIEAMKWIKDNTPPNSTILSSYPDGNIITYYAERKNIMDSNFLLIKNIDVRFNETGEMYRTNYMINAIRLMNRYSVDYMIVDEDTLDHFDIKNIRYLPDDCFEEVYGDDVKVIKSLCKLNRTGI